MNSKNLDNRLPLVVDLDGTLINTDMLYEGIILLFKKNPLNILSCIIWLLQGKVHFKKKVFKNIHIQFELLPLNEKLVGFLKSEYSSGRHLVLASASLKSITDEFSKIIPIFDSIYGTEEINLKGKNKLKVLIDNFGEFKFDYIGNSYADLEIFAKSRYSYLVNPSRSLEKRAAKRSNLRHTWKYEKNSIINYIKEIRVYQWLKNLLIFVPLITSHLITSTNLKLAISGFFAFSFVASSGYIINDLLDLNSDRIHPRKKLRPLASGKISILTGLTLVVILLSLAVIIATQLNFLFSIALLIYLISTLSYSFYFKGKVLYDVFILATLYSSRIVAGGLATDIAISFWLIAFSTFLFLSLAFLKRYSELLNISGGTSLIERGREYENVDLNLLQVMGIASGFISIVVFSLYLDSSAVRQLYSKPNILWLISTCLLFWISHLWFRTNRREMTDDPIVFALKDSTSYIILLIIVLVLWISK